MPDKRLMRSRTQKMWAGVCGGFAEYFNVDPVLVRLVVVVFTLATFPVGLVGYIVCMIVMPEGPIAAPAAAAAGSSQDSGMGAPGSAGGPAPPSAAMDGITATVSLGHSGAHSGMIGGLILVIVGALLLMGNLDLFDWGFLKFLRWRYLWPSALIAIGLWMLVRASRPKPVA
jgi:phage shock protein C